MFWRTMIRPPFRSEGGTGADAGKAKDMRQSSTDDWYYYTNILTGFT